ncbi:MAG TPA: bifunctional DNA-binding transcriptional regulator/O6-methylguanine-DNA methyltransferase Ada [Gemmatimonadales bacterium]|jgi:AraC family transcriptional regulator of adaptative response/methylated-DNA-[protein]-cysteine methyltransferase|nr:bifunctional DNA-binding transcriptional regulator/O6-methylguanine-DNA methyltransferase Ada [Gemmatimonadales bacterium]
MAAPAFSLRPADPWQIVLARDGRYDGAFVYAVKSTGIYCRPSCPSRRPRPNQVEFYDIPETAERAGFRACRRCKPKDVRGPDPRVELVRRACQEIDDRPDAAETLSALARKLQVPGSKLAKSFHALLGLSPKAYRDAKRLAVFKSALKRRSRVSPALYEAGFSSPSRIYERTHRDLGMTPAVYQRGAAGLTIRYAVVASPLGRLLVAATDRGICQVKLGESAGPLERELKSEYPQARLMQDNRALVRWTAAILRHLEGKEPHLDLPTDVRATAFQQKVWALLKKIPYGQTRSYSDIARLAGNPKATRAVARACATNPVAIVVPCHRVVSKDGTEGGYRWGTKRKTKLLAAEARAH